MPLTLAQRLTRSFENRNKSLPIARNTSLSEDRIDDLTELSFLNEPSVLNAIKCRYQEASIYTYSGIVLVSVNPYCDLPIYEPEIIQAYAGQRKGALEPHLFAIAEEAFRSMSSGGESQSIIISGESGAGKTVSAKFIMRYFAQVCPSSARPESIEAYSPSARPKPESIEERVLATNPILEAFGNAKTAKNDNSSRFGKYIEILFNEKNEMVGASIRTFLLEKTRVVFLAQEERNYHIFYQLCAGVSMAERKAFGLDDWRSFNYLNQSGEGTINNVDDSSEFRITLEAMTVAGFPSEHQWGIFRVLAAILHMGNICFDHSDGHAFVTNDSRPSLLISTRLLGIDADLFEKWLVKRKIATRQEVVEALLSTLQASACRDAVAKYLYSLVFSHIVDYLNQALKPVRADTTRFIGVLDIYGFEKFERNSFEQFCINYANEKLQNIFNQQVFKLEQELYQKEGIQWSFINFNDNQPCIDMIESRLGILSLLDEECRFPNGSDQSLLEKLDEKLSEVPCWSRDKFGACQFDVKHFAYDVTYDVFGFIEKNRDFVPPEHIDLFRSSSNSFLVQLVGKGTSTSKQSTGAAFRASLQLLTDTIKQTTVHYVRCIKPNESKQASMFDAPFVVQQLCACGILETIRISSSGYPGRWPFSDFFMRYRMLAKEPMGSSAVRDFCEACSHLLGAIGLSSDQYQVGATRVFLRAGVLAQLEEMRTSRLSSAANCLQKCLRGSLQKQRTKSSVHKVSQLQTCLRQTWGRKLVWKMRMDKNATLVQTSFRQNFAATHRVLLVACQGAISLLWRAFTSRLLYQRLRDNFSSTSISKSFRKFWCQVYFGRMVDSVILAQSVWRRHCGRQCRKDLHEEFRSVARLQQTSVALESKVVNLSNSLQEAYHQIRALELANAELSAKLKTQQFAQQTESEKKLKSFEIKCCQLENQLRASEDENRVVKNLLKEKEHELVISSERIRILEEAAIVNKPVKGEPIRDEPRRHLSPMSDSKVPTSPKNRTMADLMVREVHHAGQITRARLKKHSLNSKLDVLAQLQLPELSPRASPFIVSAPKEDVKATLYDDAVLAELAGFIASCSVTENILLPAQILERWIAGWLGMETEPIVMGEQFRLILNHIRHACLATVSSKTVHRGSLTATDSSVAIDLKFGLWIENLVHLLGVLQYIITEALPSPSFTTRALVLLQLRSESARLVEELYRSWLEELYRRLGKSGVAAIMDYQGLASFISDPVPATVAGKFSSWMMGIRNEHGHGMPFSIEAFLGRLDSLVDAFISVNLSPEIVQQLLGHLLSHIVSLSFNQLLLRKGYATWRRGVQVQFNLSQLEDWIARLSHSYPHYSLITDGANFVQLEPLLQAVKLLQLAKTANVQDADIILEACFRLNVLQMRRILLLYVPDEFEDGPVPAALLRAITEKRISDDGAEFFSEISAESVPLQLSIVPEPPHPSFTLPSSLPPNLWKLLVLLDSAK